MDRDVIFAILFAAVGTVIASTYYFGGSSTNEPSTFSKDDIRYPIQQDEEKAKAKAAGKSKKVKAPPAETYSNDDYSDDSSSESEIEQPPAEEPELE